MSEKYINELHSDHRQWLSELTLAKDEMKSFQLRLEEVNAANSDTETRAQVEHFQNQFIRENEVIDILKHDIAEYEKELAANVASNSTASDHRKVADHPELRDRMESFSHLFHELKGEFMDFVGRKL
ncbi:MAG: hypothetical protein KG003_02470 [Bacteroidetes bacterium]|nr:hypothetical protein [Bacteroidota bacterium]